MHNNYFRAINSTKDNNYSIIPDIVYYTFRKKFEEPDKAEGFNEIIQVPFNIKTIVDPGYFKYYF